MKLKVHCVSELRLPGNDFLWQVFGLKVIYMALQTCQKVTRREENMQTFLTGSCLRD